MTDKPAADRTSPAGVAPPHPSTFRRRTGIVGLIVLAVIAVSAAGYLLNQADSDRTRSEVVFDRGATVMPFDQTKTTHVFEPTSDGGAQTVTANDPGDSAQFELVRGHLQEIALQFSQGDFRNPATIHGEDMPGLADLAAGAERIQITYEAVFAGGRLTYRTNDPALVRSLHMWFEAQTADHDMTHVLTRTSSSGIALRT